MTVNTYAPYEVTSENNRTESKTTIINIPITSFKIFKFPISPARKHTVFCLLHLEKKPLYEGEKWND
jgi:hypothetical protein